jgi:hypothetical protein
MRTLSALRAADKGFAPQSARAITRRFGLTPIWCLPYFDYKKRQSDQTIPAEVFYDSD